MKSNQKGEEIILDSEIDEFDIEEMTEKFWKWMISNRDPKSQMNFMTLTK